MKREYIMKKTKKNFTLVELLCAVALVVILAGIGFSAYSYASHRGREAATRSLITRLEAALETLKTKHGFYPASAAWGDISVVVDSDTGVVKQIGFGSKNLPANAASPTKNEEKQLKDFLAVIDAESLKKNVANGKLCDAWGGAVKYCYPGKINKIKFDIVAPGADEGFGTDAASTPKDDIANYRKNGEWGCDDIANFK